MTTVEAVGRAVLGALGKHGNHLKVTVASGDHLDVRQYSVQQRMSSLFQITLVVHAENPNVDFDAVVGGEASFAILTDPLATSSEPRRWTGLCNHMEQVGSETSGLSTYQMSIVPSLWFATQRRNHRMFQQISEPDIVLQLLQEWGIDPERRYDAKAYKKRKYRVQYGESDFAFMSRMLEDAGIAFFFEQQGQKTKLVLSDAPHKNTPRPEAIPFRDSPTAEHGRGEHVTALRFAQRVRPGKVTLRDHDYRLSPAYKLMASASGGRGVEEKLERFHYTPGAFLFGSDKGEATPTADDRGKTRTDEAEAATLAQKRLDAHRGEAKVCTFETNTVDLAPGVVMSIDDHPRGDLAGGKRLLIVETTMSGTSHGDAHCHCEARTTEVPYRPPHVTPKPETKGVESATVVGPPGEEIHTDEFGRVRVHFHWDRESKMDEKSSCWLHVSQPWGGAGYGGMNLPRVGQEVLVDFLGGDPDRPVITGRVYTNLQKVPYKLPGNKTQSGWRSNSTHQTGGYNEIMFEDAAGKELVNIQAQKDMTTLVKNDESRTVKHDRSTTVWQNDSTLVGAEYSVDISPSAEGAPTHGPTLFTMKHRRIELTTGEASIILDGPNITLKADQNLTTVGVKDVALASLTSNVSVAAAAGKVGVSGALGVGVSSPDTVVIDGAVGVFINCTEPPPPPIESQSSLFSMALMAVFCPPLLAVQLGINAIQALGQSGAASGDSGFGPGGSSGGGFGGGGATGSW